MIHFCTFEILYDNVIFGSCLLHIIIYDCDVITKYNIDVNLTVTQYELTCSTHTEIPVPQLDAPDSQLSET